MQVLAEIRDATPNLSKDDFIFKNKVGKPLYSSKYNEVLHKACDIANVPYLSSHKMRSYAITQELRSGISIADAMRLSGHASAEMT